MRRTTFMSELRLQPIKRSALYSRLAWLTRLAEATADHDRRVTLEARIELLVRTIQRSSRANVVRRAA